MSFESNCAVRERTGDGVSVGRCWFRLGRRNSRKWWFITNNADGRIICPRHGDVTEIQENFKLTGKLGEDPR